MVRRMLIGFGVFWVVAAAVTAPSMPEAIATITGVFTAVLETFFASLAA